MRIYAVSKRTTFRISCLSVGWLAWAAVAGAASIPVANFSFESPATSEETQLIFGNPPSWELTAGSGGVLRPSFNGGFPGNGYPAAATEGVQFGYANATQRLRQTVAASPINFANNTIYTVQVDTAGSAGNSTYQIELLDQLNNVVAASLPLVATNQVFTPGIFVYSSGVSNPFAGMPLRISFNITNAAQTVFDNVRLDAVTIPEPSSYVLLALGISGGIGCARRRRINGKTL